MSGSLAHYEDVLADCYSWLYGGVESNVLKNEAFFQAHKIRPFHRSLAVDLGCGSGFQSLPLARLGFSILAIDQSPALLEELRSHATGLPIAVSCDDLLNFPAYLQEKADVIVCMGDTLTHLPDLAAIDILFDRVAEALGSEGRFVLTFRDLTVELSGADRFLLLRSDDERIFTCFLEYGPSHVMIHDLLYEKKGGVWGLKKSAYPKCRVPSAWVEEALVRRGFHLLFSAQERGLTTIIAQKEGVSSGESFGESSGEKGG